MAVVTGTWRFSAGGVAAGASLLQRGLGALDAAEAGVVAVELDPAIASVGHGGLPDATGALQLDAALMTGCGRVGAVFALEGRRAAAPAARAVLERSAHAQLAGAGAGAFAEAHGAPEARGPLLTPRAAARYAAWRAGGGGAAPPRAGGRVHSDTVGVLARDARGALAAGAASSGAPFKAPGRVGDAPVVGAGLFAQAGAGAAVATGDGDRLLRHCVAVRAVDRMAAGARPAEACAAVLRAVARLDPECQAAVLAVAADGAVGAAATHAGFYYTVWREGAAGGGEEATAQGIATVRVEGISTEEWVHNV